MQSDGKTSNTIEDLVEYTHWPEERGPKVPSAFSYSDTKGPHHCKQWGHDIDDDSKVMQWTKLELEPKATVKELEILRDLLKGLNLVNECRADESKEIPQYLTRDSGDIVRDYLLKISRHWLDFMEDAGQFTLDTDRVPLDIIVTHPAVRRLIFRQTSCASAHKTTSHGNMRR
jgi:hypothetical protein